METKKMNADEYKEFLRSRLDDKEFAEWAKGHKIDIPIIIEKVMPKDMNFTTKDKKTLAQFFVDFLDAIQYPKDKQSAIFSNAYNIAHPRKENEVTKND